MLRLPKNIQPLDYAALAIIGAFVLIALRFAWMDTLGAYSDDSVSYVLMAQAMSPYFATPDVVTAAAKLEQYPPLFSLLLAVSGVSHSYLGGHILVALLFGVALVLTYLLAIRILEHRVLALMVTLLFALTPSVWLNLLGILSENLYIVLSLAFLLRLDYRDLTDPVSDNSIHANRSWYIQLTLLLTLVILCRTLGIALVAAYAVYYLAARKQIKYIADWRFLSPVAIPALAATVWALFTRDAQRDLYASDVNNIFADILQSSNPLSGLLEMIAPQINSLYVSWHTAFVLYWLDEFQPTYIITLVFGTLVLAGLFIRLKQNRPDAWYVLFYLLILLVWPYPDQFNRFLYALMPLLIIYGAFFIKWIVATRVATGKDVLATGIALLFVLVSVAPAGAFITGRANFATPYADMDFSRVAPFYNIPNIDTAIRVAYRHEHLRQDLEKIKTDLEPDAVIMWYTPNYISLQSQRRAVRFPPFPKNDKDTQATREFLQHILDSGANYVFATELNPRYTAESFNGLIATRYFQGFTDVVWVRHHPQQDTTASVLLKINRDSLQKLILQTPAQ